MNLIDQIKDKLVSFCKSNFETEVPTNFSFEINIDQDRKFGDISTNIAMSLAKSAKKNPKALAEKISQEFTDDSIEKIEIAGPGFVNIFLTKNALVKLTQELLTKKDAYFKENNNTKYNYNVEFLSANPTGPIHLGNGRGGIIGDVLANILKFLDNKVTKEYYINDAGNQINKLGMSFKIRCQQEAGIEAELPEDAYHGEYLIEMAKELIAVQGKQVVQNGDEFFANYAKDKILDYLKETLLSYGIKYDIWFSEKSLHDSGKVKAAVDFLTTQGYTFESEGALWFKSTLFGDDKDRVLVRSNGEYTYTAADIAYMQSKIDRGATYMIMTLGHDHHSFAHRLDGLHRALDIKNCPLEVILYQLVKMKQANEQVKMSKRSGNAITLKDVIDTVGTDVARFFYLHKKADAQLEFDLDLALKKTEENPVFYTQYGYVRAKSIINKATEMGISLNESQIEAIDPQEYPLIKKIADLKNLLAAIEVNHQPHLIANYTIDLAGLFHGYYNQNRILSLNDKDKINSKLNVVSLFASTMKTCFDIMGISAPEKM